MSQIFDTFVKFKEIYELTLSEITNEQYLKLIPVILNSDTFLLSQHIRWCSDINDLKLKILEALILAQEREEYKIKVKEAIIKEVQKVFQR